MPEYFELASGRQLTMLELQESVSIATKAPFAALLPAFQLSERTVVIELFQSLLRAGCIEFCCVGPEAELLHDELDILLEAQNALDVITTWHLEAAEACEYFIWAAGGGRTDLLALTSTHSELSELLRLELVSSGGARRK